MSVPRAYGEGGCSIIVIAFHRIVIERVLRDSLREALPAGGLRYGDNFPDILSPSVLVQPMGACFQ
ncbi:MAG: hypothetical protein ACOX0F_05475 [Syntrophomonadaceae bacterium]